MVMPNLPCIFRACGDWRDSKRRGRSKKAEVLALLDRLNESARQQRTNMQTSCSDFPYSALHEQSKREGDERSATINARTNDRRRTVRQHLQRQGANMAGFLRRLDITGIDERTDTPSGARYSRKALSELSTSSVGARAGLVAGPPIWASRYKGPTLQPI